MTFSVWREPVQDAWIDYNGHLSEAYYVLVLGHATDAVMDAIGLGPEYRAANDASLYTVEAHIRYLDEVSPGDVNREVVETLAPDAHGQSGGEGRGLLARLFGRR